MVYLYAIDIRALPDPKENPATLHHISSSRRKKVMKYLQANDRKRCLGAGILLARILPLYGDDPEKIVCGPEGKPLAENVHFNLSHSGNLVICAVGEKAVGCDIEKTEREIQGVAKRFFHRNEAEYLQKFQGQERDEMFFRLWTWKESYIKMTGEGLRFPLQEVSFSVQKRQRGGEEIRCSQSGCFLQRQIGEYWISLCARQEVEAAWRKLPPPSGI